MLGFVIRYLISPHGKCYLNPQVRETSDSMMEFFALSSLHSKLFVGPLAFADTTASQLIEGCSNALYLRSVKVLPMSPVYTKGGLGGF